MDLLSCSVLLLCMLFILFYWANKIDWLIELQWCNCKPNSNTCKAPSDHQNQNNYLFCRPDVLPAARPTMSKHWRQTMNNNILTLFKFYRFCHFISNFQALLKAENKHSSIGTLVQCQFDWLQSAEKLWLKERKKIKRYRAITRCRRLECGQ